MKLMAAPVSFRMANVPCIEEPTTRVRYGRTIRAESFAVLTRGAPCAGTAPASDAAIATAATNAILKLRLSRSVMVSPRI